MINITAYSFIKFSLFLLASSSFIQFIEPTINESLANEELVPGVIDNVVSGIMKICISSEPDGTALVEDTSTKDEILIVFKVDHFWLIDTNKLYSDFNSDRKPSTALISSKNQIQTSKIWPQFPISPQSAVSFSGHDKESKFYNQVLVFKDYDLFRYQVKELNAKRGNLSIKLIGIHRTDHWSAFPNMKDVQYLSIPRDTRILVAPRIFGIPSVFHRDSSAYMLNPANLDNPVEHKVYSFGLPGGFNDESSLKFHHMLSDGKTIVFLTTGNLCIEKICKQFRKIIECEPALDAFADSFSYWLWRNSDFTIRLLMICLSSIMAVNLILSIFFTINQLKRIKDLT